MMFTKTVSTPHCLGDLPNISIVLGEDLTRVGVASPEALKMIGAEAAWDRLHAAGRRACVQTLFALEGAVQGLRWQALPTERRQQLMRFATQHAA